MAEEIALKNIIMIGPTEWGKPKSHAVCLTRELALPLKSGATKFTKSGTSAGMWNRWCATWLRLRSFMVRIEKVAEIEERPSRMVKNAKRSLLRSCSPTEEVTGGQRQGTGTRRRMRSYGGS